MVSTLLIALKETDLSEIWLLLEYRSKGNVREISLFKISILFTYRRELFLGNIYFKFFNKFCGKLDKIFEVYPGIIFLNFSRERYSYYVNNIYIILCRVKYKLTSSFRTVFFIISVYRSLSNCKLNNNAFQNIYRLLFHII